MDSPTLSFHQSKLDDEEPLVPARGPREEARFDITAMIDLVFMLNIFFLVTTVAAVVAEMDLPVVRNTVATDLDTAVVVSITRDDDGVTAAYLAENPEGEAFVDPDEQTARVRQAVEEGRRADRNVFLVKAERDVRLRDIQRITGAATEVPGVELRMAVIEKE